MENDALPMTLMLLVTKKINIKLIYTKANLYVMTTLISITTGSYSEVNLLFVQLYLNNNTEYYHVV